MLDLLDRIPHCFGRENLVFAGTPDEVTCAKQLRADIEGAELPPAIVENEFHRRLHQESSNTGQIFDQMGRVRAFFGF